MKKNWILMVFLLALGSWMFVACQDDEPDVPVEQVDTGMKQMLQGIKNPKIREAASWYEGHQPASLLARGGAGSHPLFEMMQPAWSYAYVSTSSSDDQYISVEVPLRARSRTLFTLPENAIAYDETKNSMYIQSLTRLVVQTDKKNGSSRGFFMTLVPSKKYMDDKKFNVYRSTYFRRDKDFDGYVYFHELDGSFSNGWRYADGKITHRVKKAEEDSSLSRGGHWEGIRVCHPKYNRVCTGYWKTTEGGGREYVEVNCYEEYAGEVCQTELVWVEDSGGGEYPDPDPSTSADGTVDSDWWGPTHNNIIKNALGDKLTKEQLDAVKAGSAEADTKEYQVPRHANMHAMTVPGKTREETIVGMRENFEKYATEFFERGTNYEHLGIALHMIMDAYSPAHNLKVWNDKTWDYIPHAFEAGFLHYKKVDKAEQAVAEVYADLTSSDYSNAGEVFDAWADGHLGPLNPDNQK